MFTTTGSMYLEQQKLTSVVSPVRAHFGRTVSIAQHTILVGAHQPFTGEGQPQKAVQSIVTSADTTIGNHFYLGFRQIASGSTWLDRWSRAIPHDVTATELEEILETDLDTEELIVARTGPDSTGGYTWLVTFSASENTIPLMTVDDSALTGTNAQVTIASVLDVAPVMARQVYVYTRSGSTWTEQATLAPRNKKFARYVCHDGLYYKPSLR